jgi:EmrB/QacA subfamily drug resistance transporter
VLLATVLGSGMTMLDGTVVSVALPAIGRDLHASLDGLQWTVNGYTLTLAALILLGGSLGDLLGRRRIFLVGVVWFALASLLCGLAPDLLVLVLARALQGIGGALLTPGSLAILEASFRHDDRARAIGAWSGLGGIAGAIGPFLGGWLVQGPGWRWVFLLNLPLAAVVVLVTMRSVPESADPEMVHALDVPGSVLAAAGLAGLTFGLIAWPEAGLAAARVWGPLLVGVLGLGVFVLAERRSRHPMLPLDVFSSRLFSATNLVTFAVYAALSGVFFLLVVALQVVAGFSPIASGAALLPVTICMLFLSARGGELGQRIGPRIPMTVGPLVAAAGVLLFARLSPDVSYLFDVLPGAVLLGLGLSLTVAPLTATVLAAAEDRHAGVASGVNNAVARAAGLLAVAAVPLVAGATPAVYADPVAFGQATDRGMLVCAGLLALGGLLSFAIVRSPAPDAVDPLASGYPMVMTTSETPRDGDIEQGAVTPDLPAGGLRAADGVLESAMATGEDDGTPGERGAVDPGDETAVAVADDAPLRSANGGPQGDGLEPRFSEPTD